MRKTRKERRARFLRGKEEEEEGSWEGGEEE